MGVLKYNKTMKKQFTNLKSFKGKKMKISDKKLSLVFLITILLLINTNIYSQTTGSIGGTVLDTKDNTPLSGATIKIVGSNRGAQTDEDGNYLILNMDVGTYSVEASFIGYDPEVVNGVQVSVDTKTKVDFSLAASGEGIKTETIEIQAERKGIDVYQSGRLVGEEQIQNTGIQGIRNIASKTAGVVTDERGTTLNIRGGRSDENQIIVDGVSTTNPVNGTSTAFVPNSLLQELAVLTGGFGAEYGNALSGVINVTTKSGTDRYTGQMEAITDEFNGDWDNTTSQGYNLYNFTLGGPLIPTKELSNIINFYGAVEKQYLAVTNPSWIADELFENGVIPNFDTKLWSYSGRLNFNLSELPGGKVPLNLKFGALISDVNQRNFRQTQFATNAGRNPLQLIKDNQYFGRIIQNVSNNFFYELQGSYYNSSNELGDAFFLADWFAYGDTLSNPALLAIQRSSGAQRQGTALGTDPNTGNVFGLNQSVYNFYQKTQLSYVSGRLDASYGLLTQKYGEHEIKFGGEYTYNTLKRVTLSPIAVANNPLDPITGLPQLNPQALWFGRDVLLNSYGYDIRDQYNNQIVSDDDLNAKNPITAAVYVRDKASFDDFTFNMGLRMDVLDANTDALIDPNNLIHADGLLLSDDDYAPSKTNVIFSPRLGFSFPVTDRTVFVAQYGQFVQSPPLEFLYINKLAFQYFFQNSVQNVAENSGLGPEKLTSYEVGFKQQVGDYLDMGLSAYYKETDDQIGVTRIVGTATVPSGYAIYSNIDFSISRGLDFYLSMRRINRLAIDMNWTLLYASGVGSDPDQKFVLAQNQEGILPKYTFPLDYDQRHTGNINLDYRFGSTDVPQGFWGGVLKNMGLNLLFSWNSGRPYTTRLLPQAAFGDDGAALSTKNQVYSNWNLRFDAKLDKSFKIYSTNLDVYIYTINLFNSELINNVYGSTGTPDDNGYLATPTGNASSSVYKENWDKRIKTITNWGTPRQIRLGAQLSF